MQIWFDWLSEMKKKDEINKLEEMQQLKED